MVRVEGGWFQVMLTTQLPGPLADLRTTERGIIKYRVVAMARRAMTCRELIGLLSLYHSGELAPRQRVRADEHLSHCEKCTGYLRGYERTIALLKESVEPKHASAKPKLREDLVQRILATMRKT
jgi:hypothetical protein